MFLQYRPNAELVEILDPAALFDPFRDTVSARYNHGEDLPDAEPFTKIDLMFLSGEPLPRCWIDPHYREHLSAA
ncbi:MAG TPA: acetyltransferase [Chromatiales bacterium]|jgi:hypothetical protein|nr:acetyltransferase [Chromatiaceae bacterium]HIB84168.1 acetyltransferase [Chromatiaceae bacterium]HIN82498.1 acetyltransferase [Chromatiales bacterium]HIO14937.1 acetyltransferase [Chromatiales bacterium]HIO54525.1 acetyltransferase [Chromatiales bacterium]